MNYLSFTHIWSRICKLIFHNTLSLIHEPTFRALESDFHLYFGHLLPIHHSRDNIVSIKMFFVESSNGVTGWYTSTINVSPWPPPPSPTSYLAKKSSLDQSAKMICTPRSATFHSRKQIHIHVLWKDLPQCELDILFGKMAHKITRYPKLSLSEPSNWGIDFQAC